jgi:hypothetical protein
MLPKSKLVSESVFTVVQNNLNPRKRLKPLCATAHHRRRYMLFFVKSCMG